MNSDFEPKMSPNTTDSFNGKRTVLLSLSFFTVLLAWSYFNFKVGIILEGLIPDNIIIGKQTTKGAILAIDNFVAVLLQPYFGDLSDRTKSKFGRRMPYIMIGTILSAIFFIIMPFVQLLIGFVLIIVLFDISMSIYRSVSIAILPDYTPEKYRSKASSIQQFIANMGGVIAFLIPTIVGIFNLSSFLELILPFTIVSVIMLVALIIMMMSIKETPTGNNLIELNDKEFEIDSISFQIKEKERNKEDNTKKDSIYKEIKDLFKMQDKSFVYMLFTVFFAYTAFAAIEAFFSSFAQFYMGKKDNVASLLFLAYSVPMILTALIWGVVGQKIGRKKAVKFGLIGIIIFSMIFSLVIVPNVYNPLPENQLEDFLTMNDYIVMVFLALISMPWMCFIVNSFPIVWSLAPKGKVGSYTGIYYTFNQFAYSIAPILLGVNLDFFRDLGPEQYAYVFPFVSICMIVSFIFMTRVKGGESELSKEELKQYQDELIKND